MPRRLAFISFFIILAMLTACSSQDNNDQAKSDSLMQSEDGSKAETSASPEEDKYTPEQISYAIGMDIASQISRLPTKFDPAEVNKGIMDALEGKSRMTDKQQAEVVDLWAKAVRDKRKEAMTQNASNRTITLEVDNLAEVSYAIGMNIYVTVKPTPYPIDFKVVAKAINDKLTDAKMEMTDEEREQAMFEFQKSLARQEREKAKAEAKKAIEKRKMEGLAFLEENKSKPGVTTTESGLQYKVIKEGDGPKPAEGDLVVVRYKGMLYNGTVFDSTFMDKDSGNLDPKRMIEGWQEALSMMPKGSKWRLFIPPYLGYGSKVVDARIPVESTLVFDIELVDVKTREQIAQEKQEEIKKTIQAGTKFLKENAEKPDVKTLDSGLQYKILVPGTGKSPRPDDVVEASYIGKLTNGTEFYNTYDQNQTVTFQVKEVLKAWSEAMPLMKEGGKWRLFSPAKLAFVGNDPSVPPGSTLIFDLELVKVLDDKAKDDYLAEQKLRQRKPAQKLKAMDDKK